MSLASSVSDLATRIASYLKTAVLPRLLPAGGSAGLVLAKSAATDYSVSWVQGWTASNFDPSAKANVSGQTFSGNVGIIKTNDAILTIEDTAAPATSFRRKQILSSANVGGGSNWLFRQTRPSDGAIQDFILPGGYGGTIWTSGNFNPANYAPLSTPVFAGSASVRNGTGGYTALIPGDANNTGYIGFHGADGVRHGYIGYSNGTYINVVAEKGNWNFPVAPLVSGQAIWHPGNFNPADKPNLGTFNLFTGKNRIPLDGMGVNDISKEIAGGTWWTGGATKAQGWPVDTSYMHLFSSNYSNSAGEYYALQIASHFFQNEDFYIRSTGSAGLQPWRTLLHDGILTNLDYWGQSFVLKLPGGLLLQGGTSVVTLDGNARARIPLITAGVTACVAVAINGDTKVNGNAVGTWNGEAGSFGVQFFNSPNATVRVSWIAFSRWKQ